MDCITTRTTCLGFCSLWSESSPRKNNNMKINRQPVLQLWASLPEHVKSSWILAQINFCGQGSGPRSFSWRSWVSHHWLLTAGLRDPVLPDCYSPNLRPTTWLTLDFSGIDGFIPPPITVTLSGAIEVINRDSQTPKCTQYLRDGSTLYDYRPIICDRLLLAIF